MLDDLSAVVSAKNPVALRTAIHVYPLIFDRGLAALRLARKISAAADDDPRGFLVLARAENRCGEEVVATPATFVGDDTDQDRLLKARRDRLEAVADPGLAAIRTKCLTTIDARRKTLAPVIIPPPLPVP
jgi:hypothetical protein